MSIVKMTIRDLAYFRDRLAKKFIPTMQEGLLSGALRCLPILHASTRSAPAANPASKGSGGSFNTGNYLRAWDAEALHNGVRVYNKAPYAGVIELGRRAGARRPPIEAIARWAQRKLSLPESEARSAAFAIANAIRRRGLLPRRVMGSRLVEMRKAIMAEVRHELESALRRKLLRGRR